MSGVAVAIGGSALVGGIMASQAQKDAANTAANSSQYGTNQSVGLQRYMYDTSRNDMMPFYNVGVQSLYDAFGYAPANQVGSTLSNYRSQTGNYTMPGMSGLQTYNALQNGGGYTSSPAVQTGQQFLGSNLSGSAVQPGQQFYSGGSQGSPYGQPISGGFQPMSTASGSDPWSQFYNNRNLGYNAADPNITRGPGSSTGITQNQQFYGNQPMAQSGNVIRTGQGIDPTGGSGKYLDMLESLKFKMDPTDDIYKWREQQTNKAINQAAAARGMFNSRPTINALGDANMALQENEINRQFQQNYMADYGKFTDLYNMATQQGQLNYGKALDAIKAGQGAAGSMGQLGANASQGISSAYMQNAGNQANLAMQQGQNQADLWSGLGAMPMNYMMLQNMLGGSGGGSSWSGLGSSGGVSQYPANMYLNY